MVYMLYIHEFNSYTFIYYITVVPVKCTAFSQLFVHLKQ